jgi:hypothetical protein
MEDCDLAGTVKLVGGVKWVPELLDHNTEEWQDLANKVQRQVHHLKQSSGRYCSLYIVTWQED